MTRIQLAVPAAAPDVQARVNGFIADAQNKAKGKDGAGCNAATALALQSLGLPALAPIILSTPTTQLPGNLQQQTQAQPTSTAVNAVNNAAAAPQPGQPPQQPPQPAAQAAPPSGPPASAQASTPAQAAAPAGDAAPTNRFYIVTSDVIGLNVVNVDATGETLGKLSSLIIDSTTGQAQYAVIDRGGFLGWSRHHVVVPFGLLRFFGQWDRPSLAMNAEKLESGPHISDRDVERLLNDPAWVRSVADYFDVAPATQTAAGASPPVAAPAQGSQITPAHAAPAAQAAAEPSAPPQPNATTGRASADAGAAHGQTVAQRYCAVCHTAQFRRPHACRIEPFRRRRPAGRGRTGLTITRTP